MQYQNKEMTKQEIDDWYFYYTQYINGYHLSQTDYKELIRLNRIIMNACHNVHNANMLSINIDLIEVKND